MNCTDSLIIMVLSLSAKPIFPALRSTLQAFKTQYVISQLVRNIQAGVKTFWRQEDTCCLNVWQWRQSLYHTYYAYTHHILFVTSLPYNFSHPALWETVRWQVQKRNLWDGGNSTSMTSKFQQDAPSWCDSAIHTFRTWTTIIWIFDIEALQFFVKACETWPRTGLKRLDVEVWRKKGIFIM